MIDKKIIERAKDFGFRIQKDETELFGQVPHVAPLAWLHIIYHPITEIEISKLEKEVKQPIPIAYKKFLCQEHNGLSIFSNSLNLYGFRKHYNRKSLDFLPFDLATPNTYEKPKDAAINHFIIGGYKWDGTLVYMDSKTSKIYRCVRESIIPLNSWPSLDVFLRKEITRISKLFDNSGRQKNDDVSTAPNPQIELK